MATRLFFHAALNTLPGTFTVGKRSALVQDYLALGGDIIATMNTTIGSLMVLNEGNSLASAASQNGYYGVYCSGAFNAGQNVGGGGQTITINIAMYEASANMNMGAGMSGYIYAWRPSNGTLVGVVSDNLALSGDVEPGSFSIRAVQGTTVATTQVAVLAGDVLICEVWQTHTQADAVSRVGRLYYDGTVVTTVNNTIVTDHASFLDFSADTMTFTQSFSPGAISMNDSLYRWLGNRGFTGTLNDRQKQYLISVAIGSSATDTLNDLWIRYGLQQGYGVAIQQIQRNWAIANGSTSTLTWNDAMGTLPP